jgi:hypothetical protein
MVGENEPPTPKKEPPAQMENAPTGNPLGGLMNVVDPALVMRVVQRMVGFAEEMERNMNELKEAVGVLNRNVIKTYQLIKETQTKESQTK